MPQTIGQWLRDATKRLKNENIDSARLDSELILSHTLKKSRTFLHANTDDELSDRHLEIAEARLDLRVDRTPIAYIIGHKDFYGRNFKVTPATLVPRPESETLIDFLLEITADEILTSKKLVDIGTGSGILGIAAKLERENLEVTLSDVSRHALNVAQENASALGADCHFAVSDLLTDIHISQDYILANLPYVDKSWQRSPETNHEPELALFAPDNGTHLIKKLIQQTPEKLNSGGWLILELDPRQISEIANYAKQFGLQTKYQQNFLLALQKQ